MAAFGYEDLRQRGDQRGAYAESQVAGTAVVPSIGHEV